MNCERSQAELEDFLSGELSEARAAEIRAHLGGCFACAAARDEVERENELFAQFYEQTALEPSEETWASIRSRIDAKPALQPQTEPAGGGWFAWLFRPAVVRQFAFAVVLIALSVAATTFFLKRGKEENKDVAIDHGPAATPTPQPTVAPTPAPSPNPVVRPPQPAVRRKQLTDQEMLNQQLARAEREYQNAIRMLDQAIVKRKDSLDPGVFKQYESSLALIDNSIAQSRRALRDRPNDPAAGQFLLAAYGRKVELMQDIAMR